MKRPTPKKRVRPTPTPAPTGSPFPMRLNKYLALKGYATRRDADLLIEKKKVFVNGTVAHVGDKVRELDTVEVRSGGRPKAYAYLAFNKPAGMDTHREATGEKNVLDALPADIKRLSLFPVGRLDKASHGLLLLTNDGRITDRLLNPKHAHEKTYEVRTKLPLRSSFKEKMEQGVSIEGYVTKPAHVELLGDNRFRITLTEGKTHQIRRMVVALFNEVTELKRIGIMNIKMGPVKSGGYRPIEGKELTTFLRLLGLGAETTSSTQTQEDQL
ncbi:rRNA pseudouridine synthase [Patescibacteria group bacterium]|nr:rRNA pseudouridine synthase [Patescibacteria group bacterium]MBU1500853.1 rRNA pseudouridine synthase [Patescibacteria group bacterium]MBU2080908.1 rRNA pseudouridine synthase [Patescibacteria group bacterium]MBU2124013.1 rRNA pseudouridine synthase [Patescibacteria group bacterium]MBU2194696.1 rRNA pseudouridine synthase [Patescibacteria group bacterium]